MLSLIRIPLKNTFVLISFIYVFLLVVYVDSTLSLIHFWLNSPEYGHGILLAAVAGYILWLRRHLISATPASGSWIGVILLILSQIIYVAAVLGDASVVKHYALVFSLFCVPLALGGRKLLKPFLFPLLLLAFSIPFHSTINGYLTRELQLISSDIGVWFIRHMGMAALQDGNVIDMGNFVLLVEEACSGLRYLLPLASLSLIASYYYKGGTFVKVIIFLSVVPITVMMNSLRIAVTGLIIKYFGSSAAEGFLHDFEGLVVFFAACTLLVLILGICSIIAGRGISVEKNFSFESTEPHGNPQPFTPSPFLWSVLCISVIGSAATHTLEHSIENVIPSRESFSQFPLAVDDRAMFPDTLDEKFLKILKPDDYFLGDFLNPPKPPINLYMAYYESQREGVLIHSPKDCLPAGGWKVLSSSEVDLTPLNLKGRAVRSIITKNDETLLVYYWVNQQGQNVTNTLAIYASLLSRMVLHGRTDGTLVRVIIPIANDGDDIIQEDEEIKHFISKLAKVFPRFLPF